MKVIPPKVSGFEDEGSLSHRIQQWPICAGNDLQLTQPARRQETVLPPQGTQLCQQPK